MALTKVVNGVEVEVSADEELAIRSKWAAADAERQLYIDTEKYKDDRKAEYPAIGDQLDALYKQMKILKATGVSMDPDLDKIISDIDAVKAKYPKPSE